MTGPIVAMIAALVSQAPASVSRERARSEPEIDAGFRLLYELKFTEARARFASWEKAHPGHPLGAASEAAGYLFEEFYAHGVFTSEFFLDDDRFLGGIAGHANEARGAAFMAANRRAQQLARRLLESN